MQLAWKNFIALSLTLHVGAGLLAVAQRVPPKVPPQPAADPWTGNGVEVDAIAALPKPVSPPPPAAPPPTPSVREEARPAPARPESRKPEARVPVTPRTEEPAVAKSLPSSVRSATAGAASSAAASAIAAPAVPVETSAESFGAQGLPTGVRHLPNAFTRALAIANRGDPRWRDLPLGRAGEAHIELAVNEQGELGELEYPDANERERLLPVVHHLLENTLLLLRAGRFSLDPKKLTSGVQRLRVVVELGERKDVNAEGDPGELFGVAWEAPRRDKPGKSGFILNSGRQVTAWVWVE